MAHCQPNKVHRMRTVLLWAGLVSVSLCLYLLALSSISHAGGFTSPKECLSFAEDDHLNCLYSYIERQHTHNDTVEFQWNAQQDLLEQIGTQQIRVDKHSADSDKTGDETVNRKDRAQDAPAPASPFERRAPVLGSPVECRAYSGGAHLNCLYAYIEIQNGRARSLKEELNAQNNMLGHLRDQLDWQVAASQDLQRRLADRDAIFSSPFSADVFPRIFPDFAYPGYGYLSYGHLGSRSQITGFPLYLGAPGFYWDRPFYGPTFVGPRYYGHHRR
jgi:hypothetical protein